MWRGFFQHLRRELYSPCDSLGERYRTPRHSPHSPPPEQNQWVECYFHAFPLPKGYKKGLARAFCQGDLDALASLRAGYFDGFDVPILGFPLAVVLAGDAHLREKGGVGFDADDAAPVLFQPFAQPLQIDR